MTVFMTPSDDIRSELRIRSEPQSARAAWTKARSRSTGRFNLHSATATTPTTDRTRHTTEPVTETATARDCMGIGPRGFKNTHTHVGIPPTPTPAMVLQL